MALTVKLLCLAALLILFPTAEVALAQHREAKQVVQPGKGSFYRGAVESPPAAFWFNQFPSRDAVEHIPVSYHAPNSPTLTKLKVFTEPLFASQFVYPSLHADYFRQTFPNLYQPAYAVPLPQPQPLYNFVPSYYYPKNEEACTHGQGARPDPSDCSGYQICLHEVWTSQKCADGLHFNPVQGICDWPANVRCGSAPAAPAPAAPAPTTTVKPTTAAVVAESTTAKPVVTPPPSSEVAMPDTGYKVICYFTNWAVYRPGDGKYNADNIDGSLCTHIIYGFATLGHDGTMRIFDTWADTEDYGHKLYSKVTAFRQKGIKVSIALGGWNDSLGSKYSVMVNNPAARKKFVDAAITFIETHGFDGLDLDWEYPKCWQVDCNAGPDSDKQAFTAWVKELSEAFKPRGWLLSAAVSPSKTVIDFGYEVAELNKYLDWIGVMTYDYFGNWDKETGHVAPLYAHSEVDNIFFNTNYTLNYWIRLGADPKKVIMGLPMYGQSFTLADANSNGLNAKASGPGEAGEFTRQGGFLAFYEICHKIKNEPGWKVVQDPEGAMGPYAYRDRQWTSFDDVAIIRKKSELVKTMGIGGAMIWALDLDDFRNRCGCEAHPLLRTINRVLRDYPGPDPKCDYSRKY